MSVHSTPHPVLHPHERLLVILFELKQMKVVINTTAQDMKHTLEKVVELLDI